MTADRVLRAFAVTFAVTVWLVWYGGGSPVDAIAYWGADPLHPYEMDESAYVYTPAFIHSLAPTLGLPFDVFVALIRALELASLYALVGPLLPLVFVLSPVASDINAGNINIALTAAAWFGLRHPGLWAFAFLTKMTPGVGVIWFAARREWRQLAIALGVTVAIALVSFVVSPAAWFEFPAFLREFDSNAPSWIAVRLPFALALLVWGAVTGRPWVMPIVVLLALPRLYLMSPCVLVPLANREAWERIASVRLTPRLTRELSQRRERMAA